MLEDMEEGGRNKRRWARAHDSQYGENAGDPTAKPSTPTHAATSRSDKNARRRRPLMAVAWRATVRIVVMQLLVLVVSLL